MVKQTRHAIRDRDRADERSILCGSMPCDRSAATTVSGRATSIWFTTRSLTDDPPPPLPFAAFWAFFAVQPLGMVIGLSRPPTALQTNGLPDGGSGSGTGLIAPTHSATCRPAASRVR